MSKSISQLICEAAKNQGIEYKSINPAYIEFANDAQRLVQLYKELHEITEELGIIGKRHKLNGFQDMIKFDIDQINSIDHDLIRMAKKLRQEQC